jgi:ferric-dicitrate binding protein FerR (iron transport regulator)
MFTKNKTDWGLLAKYLAGEANQKEMAAVEKWLGQRAENRAEFGKLRSEWKVMESMKQFDVDNAWKKLHGRIIDTEEPVLAVSGKTTLVHRRMSWGTTLRIAASLLLLIAIGASVAISVGRSRKVTIITAASERLRSVTLPDGSTVTMNGSTTLSYAKHFLGNSRNVSLSGEAFFEVTPDKSKPFIIHTDGAAIKVVGTSFNVDTRGSSSTVEVYVSTGIVEVYKPESRNNSVFLHPGEIGKVSKNIINSKMAGNENAIAWKTGKMDFRDIPWSEAVAMLNKMYNVNIILKESGLSSIKTTGEYLYPEEPLDTILRILCQQSALRIEKSDNKIYLSK